ncbi:MAG: GGDEF domain-containing protein [Campylobacterales bacterium]|nr:GGDEF domain-containing protein [Campylobacterales bacterium]
MSLFKYISLVVLAFILTALLFGGIVNYFLTKDLIYNSMKSNSENLTLSIVDSISKDNLTLFEIEETIDYYFKNGNFISLKVFDKEGSLIIQRVSKEKKEESKYIEYINRLGDIKTIKNAPKKSQQVGKVESVLYVENLDTYLFALMEYSIGFFLIFMIVVVFGLRYFSKKLLFYLSELESQMEQVSKKNFIHSIIEPKVTEFFSLVHMFDKVTDTFQKIVLDEEETQKKYYQLLYVDTSTKLYNRKYFMENISKYIGDSSVYDRGTFVIISFVGIDEAKEKIGFKKLESLLNNIGTQLKENTENIEGIMLARINDSDFAFLIPEIGFDFLRAYIEKIFRNIRRLFKEDFEKDLYSFISAGVTTYTKEDNIGSLFSKGDYALSFAKRSGYHDMFYLEDEENVLIFGKEKWKEIIYHSLFNDQLALEEKPIKEDEHIVMYDYSLVLTYEEKKYGSNSFIPVLANFNLLKDIDKFGLEEFFNIIDETEKDNLLINISESFVKDTVMVGWFKDMFESKEECRGKNLYFESNYNDIVRNTLVYRNFIELLTHRGFFFGIGDFSINIDSYSLLSRLKPSYIKIDKDELIVQTDKEQKKYQELLTICDKFNIEIIAKGVKGPRDVSRLNKAGSFKYIN